jgi:hypothetical protein
MKQRNAPAEAVPATENQKRSQADSESVTVNVDLDSVDNDGTAPQEE